MIEEVKIERLDTFYVARDDLLPGGTKRRALLKWLPTLNQSNFIYAGSVYGSGGWALAEACRDLGFGCTLALARSDYKPIWLNKLDCEIIWHDPQPVEQIQNSFLGKTNLLPLGFNDPGFKACLSKVFRGTSKNFSEIWMPCVSGTLVQSAQLAWPDLPLNAVCVARHHGDIGNAKKFQATEKYHQPAKMPPPYPANSLSDAKLWSFARQFALKDALVWNTSI